MILFFLESTEVIFHRFEGKLDGYVKSESVAGVGVLCGDECGIIFLAKGCTLVGLSVPLIELIVAREAIQMAFF